METGITVKTETGISTNVMDLSFGVENLISSDIQIPKILLMQSTSEIVNEGKASPGDLANSFEKVKIGDAKRPLAIIPFHFTNTWTIKREQDGKMVFDHIEDRIQSDSDRDFEQVINGVKYTTHKTLNVFCLIKGGNLQVPFMVSFNNRSFKGAAKPYLNKAKLLVAEGRAPAHIVWNLGVAKEENVKGKWFSFSLEAAKDENGKDIVNTNDEVLAAYNQYKSLSASLKAGAKIDLSDLGTESTTEKEMF
jgi:hypothetical protein